MVFLSYAIVTFCGCKFIREDPQEYLKDSGSEEAMAFFCWLLDQRKTIKKRSTLNEYKRMWMMVYRKSTGLDFPRQEAEYLQNHITQLSVKYKLDILDKEKPVLNADDMYLILHHHWVYDRSIFPHEPQRLQFALMLLVQAYTATRPRVISYRSINQARISAHYVGQGSEAGSDDESDPQPDSESETLQTSPEIYKTVTYRDIKLLLLPSPNGIKDLLVMEITLRYCKGWNMKPRPKTLILYEVDDLVFYPTILMIAIAILDDAFDSDIRSVDDLYQVRMPTDRRSLEFTWKRQMLNVPVFRQPDNKSTFGTSLNQPIRYNTYIEYLKRLGIGCGFMQLLNTYMIRRGAGEAIEAVATQGQLQQVMNHQNAGIYQAYINQQVQVDTMAATIGKPSKRALIKAATHMSRYIDPRAPQQASSEDLERIGRDYNIESLIQAKETFFQHAVQESCTLKKAKADGTKLYTMYKDVAMKVKSTQALMKRKALENTRHQFFERINTIEINNQLHNNNSPHNSSDIRCPSLQLEERRAIAALIALGCSDLDENKKTLHRLATADTLVLLGRARETAPQSLSDDEDQSSCASSTENPCEKTQCFICFWGKGSRRHFSSVYKTRNHLKSYHLRGMTDMSEFLCLEPDCKGKGVQVKGISGLNIILRPFIATMCLMRELVKILEKYVFRWSIFLARVSNLR
ncbi:hypothetical protein QBC38DRAFT_425312 [Podospora fimiseda]|uniref:FluG domain-containing protein n=1 Tax=Podospora fimiseda TaxID=252190 RepID=A0AAN7GXI0_9PEZI|nr:hypothetical protein QBC38DRAFT_425312 [Podospora fimiseda]